MRSFSMAFWQNSRAFFPKALLLWVAFSILAHQGKAQTIPQLEAKYAKITDKIDKMSVAFQLAERFEPSNSVKASEYAGAAYRLANEVKDYRMMSESAFLGAQISIKLGKPADAKVRLGRSAESAITAGDFKRASDAYNLLEDMALKAGDMNEAYQVSKKQVSMYKAVPGAKMNRPVLPAPPSASSSTTNSESGARAKTLQTENEVLKTRVNALENEVVRLGGERDNLRSNTRQLSEQGAKVSKEREEALRRAESGEQLLSAAEIQKQEGEKREKRKQKLVEALSNENSLDSIVFAQELQQKNLELADATIRSERSDNFRNLLLIISASVLLLAGLLYKRFSDSRKNTKALTLKNDAIRQEQERSDELLLNILPAEIATELKASGKARPRQFNNVSVLFTDFKNFTSISEQLTPEELVAELDHCFKAFDFIARQYKVEKIKTIGDAYMCATGLSERNELPPTNLIQAALDIQEFLKEYKEDRIAEGRLFFEARIGVHSGPAVAGVVGINKFAYDIWGDTVNIAARMEANCDPGRINVSESTHNQIKYDFSCTPRGKIAAKNKGEIEMYYVDKKIRR